MFENFSIWQNVLRPVLAFLGASIAAGLAITAFFYVISVFGESPEPISVSGVAGALMASLLVAFYVAFIAVIPTIIFVFILRFFKLPRFWGDAIAGGLVGLGAMQLVAEGYSAILEAPHPVALLFGGAGAVAGLSYWFLTGKPKPPYGGA